MYFHSLALQEGWLSPLFFGVTAELVYHTVVVVTALVERRLLVIMGGVLVASRMYVSTFALVSCYERVFLTKTINQLQYVLFVNSNMMHIMPTVHTIK